MSLPTFPSGNNNNKRGGNVDKPQPDFQDLKLPSLPDLGELEPLDNLDPIEDNVKQDEIDLELPEKEFPEVNQADESLPGEPLDLEDLGLEELEGIEDFEDEVVDDDDFSDDEESNDNFEEEEIEDWQEELEEDFDEEEFSLIPTVEFDEEDDDEWEDGPDISVESNKSTPKKDGFKELDDESVKEFFDNIKSKLSGLFKKGKDDNEDETPTQSKKLKPQKEKKPKGNSSIKKLINKKNLSYLIGAVVALVLVFLAITFLGGRYSPLSELSTDESSDNTEVTLQNFTKDGDIVYFDVINQGDMSADFFMEAKFTEKTLIPFTGDSYSCTSDIIALDTKGQAQELLRCEPFDSEKEYKIDITIIDIQ